ncbi:hypothetical protein LT85_2646 [Collimonas arenae]|uniref:Uncharacterized protein n=1 Tax=Collimonas arenae TaxID=279058 RepID=A0A0A1FDV0_9BURK|nr:hypothetical protein LT85_2646 [Collimonas arenae]
MPQQHINACKTCLAALVAEFVLFVRQTFWCNAIKNLY